MATNSIFHLKLMTIVKLIIPEPCDVLGYMKTTFSTCYHAYSKENEDMTPYNKPGWILVENTTKKDELNQLCPKPWRYQRPAETDTVPKWGRFSLYPGGGFVADLGYENTTAIGIIGVLHRNEWLDRQSRAVIIEFSAFNPTTNLLVVATYFYEIQPSGFKGFFNKTYTISLYSKETGSHQFYLICMLVFIIFVLLFCGRICYTVCKQGLQFFKFFWNWVEILQVVFSVLTVVMNIVRSSEAVSIIRKMNKNIYANVNFQEVVALTEAENAVLGILVFLVSLKLLRLIRYNKQVVVFSRTLKASANLLSSFMVVFVIGFVAFLHFGMLIFETGSVKYSSFLRATYFQLVLVLGKVKKRPIEELSEENRVFGRLFASLILVSLTILFMNFFIAAINDALLKAKNSVLPNKLYELLDEPGLEKDEVKKSFFDRISKLIKQSTTTSKNVSELPRMEATNSSLDAPLNAKTSVFPKERRELVDGRGLRKDALKKVFFDRTSKLIKQSTTANKNVLELSSKGATHTFLDAPLKAKNFVFPKDHRELVDGPGLEKDDLKERFFDKISTLIKQSTTPNKNVSEVPRKDAADTTLEKYDRSETISQLRREPLAKDVTELKLNELREKEEYVFQRLDSIVRADYDEDDTFNLLCHQIYLEKATGLLVVK